MKVKFQHKSDGLIRIVRLIMSLCTALMLCMTFETQTGDIGFQSALTEIFWNLESSLSGTVLISTIIFAMMYFAGNAVKDIQLPKKGSVLGKVISFAIAVIWLAGECFRIDNLMYHAVETTGQIVKSVIYIVGASYLLYVLFVLFFMALERKTDFIIEVKNSGVAVWLRKHQFSITTLLLLFCWSIPVIISYPGNMCSDAWAQLYQFWSGRITAHHPPVHTLLIGFFTWIGKTAFGSANIGLFCFILIQSLVYSLIISYALLMMTKMTAPKWLQILYFVSAAFLPFYANRVNMVLKDNLYSISVLLLMIEMINAFLDLDSYVDSKCHIILGSVSIMGVILFRNNGKHILYPTVLLLFIILLYRRNNIKKSTLIKSCMLLLLPVMFANVVNIGIIKHYDISEGSFGEALSFPLQQVARYVTYYSDEVTDEEREALSVIIDYDHLAENYNPRISDPVKATFNRNATRQELMKAFKIYVQMFFKHPTTYVTATMNQNYYLIYPFVENSVVYTQFSDATGEATWTFMSEEVGFEKVTTYDRAREALYEWNQFLYRAPIVGLLSHTALYVIALFYLMIYALINRLYKFLLLCLPIVLSVVVIILAPAIYNHPRYAFPIIYSLPLIIAYYICLRHREGSQTKSL